MRILWEMMVINKHCHCQDLNPEEWDEKEYSWDNPRFFYRITTRMAFNQPFSYYEDVAIAIDAACKEGYTVADNPLLLLKSGLFKGEILVEIELPNGEICKESPYCLVLLGRFFSRISSAPLLRIGKEIDRLTRDLTKKGETVQGLYLSLLTCPPCARKKGNQTIIIADLQ